MTRSAWQIECTALVKLALPIMATQVGMLFMGTVDALMVGRISGTALAAVTLGNLYLWSLIIFGNGVLMALDPLVSQAIGAGDRTDARLSIQRGLVLALALSIPTGLLVLACEPLFVLFGQPAEVIGPARDYCLASIPGILPFLVFVVLRQTLQAQSRTLAILVVILVANILNALANWVLIFGNLGCPSLGVAGSAWATTICRWVLPFALLALGWRDLRNLLRPWQAAAVRLRPLLRMLALGTPIGMQFCLEMWAFAITALFMGMLGKTELAAHQPAINLAALSYQVPVGIGAAAAVRVGYAVGRGEGLQRAALIPLAIASLVMFALGAVFLTFPQALAAIFIPGEPQVIALAALLLPLAGLFQVFDGLQAVAAGVLRGTGDTRAPMISMLVGFWFVGVPTSMVLGFDWGFGLGAVGLWWGLVVGLGAVAIFLLIRVRTRLGEEVQRTKLPPTA